MHPGRGIFRVACSMVVLLALPLILGGCFAMQKDLDPIRSDISVMEKQFMELQRDQARLRAKMGEPGMVTEEPGMHWESFEPDDETGRVESLESRLNALEARVRELERTSQPLPTGPMEPEPVMIEPLQEPGAQPPVLVTPGVAPSMPSRATMAAEDIYKQGMTAYKAGDYRNAEADFRHILEEYPENRLADNAAYWIGEIQFGEKEYVKAIESFKRVINDYPIGDKVPDAVFMTGRAYEELGQKDKAREAYKRVMDNYPYSDAARNARQRMESIY